MAVRTVRHDEIEYFAHPVTPYVDKESFSVIKRKVPVLVVSRCRNMFETFERIFSSNYQNVNFILNLLAKKYIRCVQSLHLAESTFNRNIAHVALWLKLDTFLPTPWK